MQKLRKYGNPPYKIAVIHGGPGAAGELAPVAGKLAADRGVLEPLQTADSVPGQVAELKAVLENHGDPPVYLIGFSWGAWLSLILSAKYPALVKKLILVSSGGFEKNSMARTQMIRLSRLSPEDKNIFSRLSRDFYNPDVSDKTAVFAELGNLFSKSDAYDLLPDESVEMEYQMDIYHRVFKEAAELRSGGKLPEFARQIQCPVAAIHGDYDPHPAEDVQKPLAARLTDFRFILLKNCGHRPWREKHAQAEFFRVLDQEVKG